MSSGLRCVCNIAVIASLLRMWLKGVRLVMGMMRVLAVMLVYWAVARMRLVMRMRLVGLLEVR